MAKEKKLKWGTPELAPEDSLLHHYRKLMKTKPSVPGEATRYEFLPPGGYWGGLVKEGQVIRVIDLEGHQCFDTIMYDAQDLYNRLSTCYCWAREGKWDNWKPGDGIWSRNLDKLAIISEDTSEGHHAFAGAFCSEPHARACEGIPNRHGCLNNFVAAMRMAGFPGFSAKDIDWGSCISVFMNIPFYPDGTAGPIIPVSNKPGDYIDLTAKRDLIVTISNCPEDTGPCNNWKATPMYAIIFNPNKNYIDKTKALERTREAEYRQTLGYSEDEYDTFVRRR
ncbi:DUF1989 domain-containing protein [Chloroflexota bacterium]